MWTEMGRQAFQLPVSSWSHQTSPNTFDAGLHMQNIHHSRHWQISRIPRKLKGSQANPTTLVMKAAVYCKHGAQQLATWNNITNINIHKREKNQHCAAQSSMLIQVHPTQHRALLLNIAVKVSSTRIMPIC